MNNPLISIVVCTFNRAHWLQKTIESIFQQKYEPVEILVLDDGSTDNTGELLSAYSNNIRYYRQENKGIAVARTQACKLAQGEYIAFQDDDDIMPPDRIVHLYQLLKHYPHAVLSFGNWAMMNQHGELTGEESQFPILKEYNGKIREPLLIQNGYAAILWTKVVPAPSATLFRKSDGERIGWFDRRFFHSYEDMDFFARLSQLGPIVYTPKVVWRYRKGHTALTLDNTLSIHSEFLFIEKHLSSMGEINSELKRRLQFKMLLILKKIAYLCSLGKQGRKTYYDCIRKGVALLNARNYSAFWWYGLIRLPLHHLVVKHIKKYLKSSQKIGVNPEHVNK